MYTLYITCIVLSIIIFLWLHYVDEPEEPVVSKIIAAFIISVILTASIGQLIVLGISKSYIVNNLDEFVKYTKVVKTTYIKSLEDNTGTINGSFVLGSGTISSNPKFFYYEIYSDSTYRLESIYTQGVTIVETDAKNPCVIQYETSVDWSKSELSPFLFKLGHTNSYYRIFVPKNTIIKNYSLDAK